MTDTFLNTYDIGAEYYDKMPERAAADIEEHWRAVERAVRANGILLGPRLTQTTARIQRDGDLVAVTQTWVLVRR